MKTFEAINMTQTTNTKDVEIYEINLEHIYKFAPQSGAENLLSDILKSYVGLEYKVIVTLSPDCGAIYFDEEFKQFVLEFSEDDIQLAAIEYAKQKGYDGLVVLDEGYEIAIALIREKD